MVHVMATKAGQAVTWILDATGCNGQNVDMGIKKECDMAP